MAGRRRHARPEQHRFAQHVLASDTLAVQLVDDADVAADDRVVEFGAGTGILTEALAARAGQVLAVELDPALVTRLTDRFVSTPTVSVWHADALSVPLPATPYRVVANVPFHRTAALLRRLLDDPCGSLVRADLILQWQVARHRAAVSAGPPVDLLGATWGPWWRFRRGRRLPATLFRPPPSVDAAVLTITRRRPPRLPMSRREEYATFVRDGFAHARLESFLAVQFGRRRVTGLTRALHLDVHAGLCDLHLDQWERLFEEFRVRRR